MRLVSWNCYRGECRQRAAEVASLLPDITVLQECGRPVGATDRQCLWFGDRPTQGVGIVASGEWFVEAGPVDPSVPHSVYPVRVTGPIDFHLLAVWAQPRPTYVRAILDGVERYRSFLAAAPSVIVGDFNSHSRWDRKDPKANHTVLTEYLRREFGLTSAYHSTRMIGDTTEEATLYWQWKQEQSYHIDYCFVPESWVARLATVTVGSYHEWVEKQSDHRPLLVDVRVCE